MNEQFFPWWEPVIPPVVRIVANPAGQEVCVRRNLPGWAPFRSADRIAGSPRVGERERHRNDGVHDSLPGAGNGPPSVAGLMRSEEPGKVIADRYRFSTFPIGEA